VIAMDLGGLKEYVSHVSRFYVGHGSTIPGPRNTQRIGGADALCYLAGTGRGRGPVPARVLRRPARP
jgi:hypothetical protein